MPSEAHHCISTRGRSAAFPNTGCHDFAEATPPSPCHQLLVWRVRASPACFLYHMYAPHEASVTTLRDMVRARYSHAPGFSEGDAAFAPSQAKRGLAGSLYAVVS